MTAVTFHPYAVVASSKLMGLQQMDERFEAEILAPTELLSLSEDGQLLVWIRLPECFAQCVATTVRVDGENFEPISFEHDVTNAKVTVGEKVGESEIVDLKIAIALPFGGLQRLTIGLPNWECDSFMDALSLLVNARQVHRGEVEAPDELIAKKGIVAG
jgi:hypothetical protein